VVISNDGRKREREEEEEEENKIVHVLPLI
jgi:hypothetical protein